MGEASQAALRDHASMVGQALLRRRLLAGASAALYVLVFCALIISGKTDLGIGRLFYLAIALAALASGPLGGAGAGILASVLYAVAVLVTDPAPLHVLTTATNGFRIVTFAVLGVLVGAAASSNRELVSRLHLLAVQDPLTGLANARAFEDAQHRHFASGRNFGLLLGDMDGLKEINDEYGHAAGDDALRRMAIALSRAIGPAAEAFRIGGDEFAVLADARTLNGAARIADEVVAALAEAGHRVSFGWALGPSEGENIVALYRAADARMYDRKRLGRSLNATQNVAPFDNVRPARIPRWSVERKIPENGSPALDRSVRL